MPSPISFIVGLPFRMPPVFPISVSNSVILLFMDSVLSFTTLHLWSSCLLLCALVENDLYYTGGTIIFDHGHGISTLYMHLKDIFVEKGQMVKQGDVIGTVGSTGRATGAHLDIRLNWFDTRLDPMSALKLNAN